MVARRARHVVTEDDRVERFVEASARGDLALMGKLLVESHRSLQHDYEVSCEELDFLVDTALGIEGVLRLAHDRRRIRRMHRYHAPARRGRRLPRGDRRSLRAEIRGRTGNLFL